MGSRRPTQDTVPAAASPPVRDMAQLELPGLGDAGGAQGDQVHLVILLLAKNIIILIAIMIILVINMMLIIIIISILVI